jgi:hypothetical protein
MLCYATTLTTDQGQHRSLHLLLAGGIRSSCACCLAYLPQNQLLTLGNAPERHLGCGFGACCSQITLLMEQLLQQQAAVQAAPAANVGLQDTHSTSWAHYP